MAVDLSELSHTALVEAADLASKFGAELTLLHVHASGRVLGLSDEPGDDRFFPSRRAMESQRLAEWKDEASRRSERPVHVLQRDGVAWDAIVGQAREGGFDMIVVGSHGRSGLAHALIGSVAEKVVRHAHCPVFVVREG